MDDLYRISGSEVVGNLAGPVRRIVVNNHDLEPERFAGSAVQRVHQFRQRDRVRCRWE
jgi:hypothetical protein